MLKNPMNPEANNVPNLNTLGLWIQAWHLVKGSKAAVWGVFFAGTLIVTILSGLCAMLILGMMNDWGNTPFSFLLAQLGLATILCILTFFVLANVISLLLMLGIKRSRGEAISYASVKPYLSRWLPITLTFFYVAATNFVLITIANMALAVLLHTSGTVATPDNSLFTLSILLNMTLSAILAPLFLSALPLVAERKYPAWKAFNLSIELGKRNWKSLVLCLLLYQILYLMLLAGSVAPFVWPFINLILIIWLIPYAVVISGMAYSRIICQDPLLKPATPRPVAVDEEDEEDQDEDEDETEEDEPTSTK